MAVVSVKEGYTGVEAGGSLSKQGMKRTATRVFTVVTNDPSDSAVLSFPISAGGVTVPGAGAMHPDYALLFSGVAAVSKKGPCYFEIKVPYETPDPNKKTDDPLTAPADISWDDAERTVAYDKDMDGHAVVNTNNEPFDPPLQREVSDPVLVIERNQASFDPDDKLLYQDTVSSGSFWGAAAGRPKMGKIKAHLVNGETPYWRVRYEITFRMKTPSGVLAAKAWWRCILNQGVKYRLQSTDPASKAVPTPNGELCLLKQDGTKETDPANAYWLYFREFPDQSWSALGL
jgi:hypothetical protein